LAWKEHITQASTCGKYIQSHINLDWMSFQLLASFLYMAAVVQLQLCHECNYNYWAHFLRL